MRSLLLAATLIFLAATLIFAAAPGAAQAEERYVNARFGYAICVPDGLVGQDEADNGDGRRFEAADGARLLVYGGHNALDETLADRRAATIERLGAASYQSAGPDWFVASGRAGETIYYVRASLRRDVFSTMELTYPAAAAARWNAVAAQLSRCFKPR